MRLAANLVGLYAPLVAAVLLILYAHAASELLEIIDQHTAVYLDEIQDVLRKVPDAERQEDLSRIGALLAEERSGFALLGPGGEILQTGGFEPMSGARVRPAGRSIVDAVLLRDGDRLRYLRELPDGRRLELTAGVDSFLRERSEIQRGFWITLAFGLSLVALASLLATRRALSPLRRATLATESVNPDRLDARLPVRGTKDDVDRHAIAVNQLLDRLEAGFARIGAFSLDVAHELRTPINRILNGAEVALLDCKEDDPSREVLEMIRDTGEQMSRLIEGLLLLARDADGRLRLRTAPLPLADLFGTLGEIYGPACEERGLRFELGAAEGAVSADRTLLMRAVANLLDNALAHTPPGGVIRMEASWEDGVANIRVSDTGAGFPESERERIFERFVRLDRPGGRQGTGLGLPIARMLARAHGGDLIAGSAGARGALFILRVPGWPPGAATPAPAGSSGAAPPGDAMR